MPTNGSVLLGVMTSPLNPRLRTQWREWGGFFKSYQKDVDVRFVIGKEFHKAAPLRRLRAHSRAQFEAAASVGTPVEMVADERAANGDDFIIVDGREKLPHVGKVTEKSAAWWSDMVHERPGYSYYCKTDDDTLVHLDRLHETLAAVTKSRGADAAIYFGHIKWRGWNVGHHFQACGGGWGPARKTGDDIAIGGVLPGGIKYPPCPYAAGPYPYMSGGMVCMSRKMAATLSADGAFRDFFAVAKQHNSIGVPCRNPQSCAAQPYAAHMWHHEDAGVGFNVFRAIVAANATGSLVPVPGHYNDAGIIERTRSAQDAYWSTRSIFVHGIKGPVQFESAKRKWKLDRPTAYLGLRCFSCESGGTNGHNGDWLWARLPCRAEYGGEANEPPLAGINASGRARHCPVTPGRFFTCCGWPWVVPELRELILAVLRQARGGGLLLARMYGEMRRELRRTTIARNPKGCVRDCLDLQLPGPQHLGSVMSELALRGDVVVEKVKARSPALGDAPRRARGRKPYAPMVPQSYVRLVDAATPSDLLQ